jgi:hypothetical protein
MLGKHLVCAIALLSLVSGLSACNDDGRGGPPPSFTTQIGSDPAFDGDIALTSSNIFVVTQGMSSQVQSVFAGIDPGSFDEYRTFLDFPLGGQGGVPTDAIISAAYLDIYVNSLRPANGSLPLRIELVTFQPPTLIPSDFDTTQQPAIAFIQVNPPIIGADVGTNISVDITSLMIQAQRLGLPDLQLRIMEDLGPAIPVIMEINDTTGANRASFAPLLTVTYF